MIRKKLHIATERPSDLMEKIGGAGGGGGKLKSLFGSKSKLKIKKKKDPEAEALKRWEAKRGPDDSPRNPRITERFLEDHGFTEAESSTKKAFTYERLNDTGKYRVYTGNGTSVSGKETFVQNTFKNPSLRELRDWMGY
tara:strand:- start:1477 stop:1893 length:417 start_codon:yes stop_codon:yes gene_type:complete